MPMHMFTIDLRSDQQTRQRKVKPGDKAAVASLSALSVPIMLTCEGAHAMILWFCMIFRGV